MPAVLPQTFAKLRKAEICSYISAHEHTWRQVGWQGIDFEEIEREHRKPLEDFTKLAGLQVKLKSLEEKGSRIFQLHGTLSMPPTHIIREKFSYLNYLVYRSKVSLSLKVLFSLVQMICF